MSASSASTSDASTTAIALGQAGADVVVNHVSGEDHADAVVGEIRRSGAKAYAHKAGSLMAA